MLGASAQVVLVVRRSFVIAATALLILVPTGTGAGAAPRHQEPPDGDSEAADRALADIDAAEAAPEEIAGTLDALQGDVNAQLDQLELAQQTVAQAESRLADAQSVVDNTEMRIEELQVRSDAVVADAFVNPPIQEGVEVFASESMEEAAVRQGLLDVHAADSAQALDELEEQQAAFEEQKAAQDAALVDADEARAEAEAALADLEAAVSAQTQFVLDVRDRLASGTSGSDDPAVLARQAELQQALDEVEAAVEYARAMEALAEAQRQREAAGVWECPVQGGGLNFADTWGAPRSGGRSHQGSDMMADRGTPTVAPVSGTVEHRENSLGGLTWYVYGDDGHTYYGAHLDSYENVGAGHVERGTVIGYVGDSGNAAGTPPHLHFEYQPGGGASVDPYDRLVTAC